MITDEQVDDMLHALGQSQTPDRKDMGWRNYFHTGDLDDSWEDLMSKGFAERTRNLSGAYTYRVSPHGLKVLGVTTK